MRLSVGHLEASFLFDLLHRRAQTCVVRSRHLSDRVSSPHLLDTEARLQCWWLSPVFLGAQARWWISPQKNIQLGNQFRISLLVCQLMYLCCGI
jgi:hypothetical protein